MSKHSRPENKEVQRFVLHFLAPMLVGMIALLFLAIWVEVNHKPAGTQPLYPPREGAL